MILTDAGCWVIQLLTYPAIVHPNKYALTHWLVSFYFLLRLRLPDLTIHLTDNAKNQRCRNLLLRFVLYSNAQESDSAWQSNEANGLSPKVCHNFSCNAEPDV